MNRGSRRHGPARPGHPARSHLWQTGSRHKAGRRGEHEPNLVALLYLVAGVLFILALRGLSSPDTSRRGNHVRHDRHDDRRADHAWLASAGRSAAWGLVVGGIAVGGGIGAVIARRVPMTSMPELVAAFHSLVGMAAVLVAAGAFYAPAAFDIGTAGHIHGASLIEMSLGVAIGAITFTGSVIAFLKLSGRMSGKPIMLPGRHIINLALFAALIFFIYGFFVSQSAMDFWIIVALSLTLGVLIIIPIGGADMPVVISMLNSYSGWAAAGIGFTLGNSALIITGALVGSSGAILSYIMCKGMNRSFISVILGGFGGEVAGPARRRRAAAGQARLGRGRRLHHEERAEGHHRAGLRHGGGAGAARAARNGRQAQKRRRRGQIRHPSGGRPHARPHERAAGRSERAL